MDVRRIPKAQTKVPTVAVNASLTTLMASFSDAKPTTSTSNKPDYLPATTFQGPKPGYVFTKRAKGVGYYLDRADPLESSDARTTEEQSSSGQEVTDTKDRGLNSEELLKQAEQSKSGQTVEDARALRKLTTNFDKKYRENLSQRTKYPDVPEKFMESEVDLDEAVQELFQIVNAPELYPTLVETGVLSNLLHLLVHENRDIAADVIQLIASLTDTTDNEEWLKPFQTLVSHLSELTTVELLVQHLEKLTEQTDEEATVIFNLLTALDNMMDVLPDVAGQATQNKSFVNWLLGRLSRPEFDSVKQMCGEMLVELLQHNAETLLGMNALEVILHCIQQAITLSRPPMSPPMSCLLFSDAGSEDEMELMDNLFDGLSCCLLLPQAKKIFIKVLEFATTQSSAACRSLLDASGLKTVFAFFMQKLAVSSKKDPDLEQKSEEMILTIISNLLQELQSKAGYERVAAKFVENEFEKCDRLFEIYYIYHARVIAAETELLESGIEEPEELMGLKMESGLATLQHVSCRAVEAEAEICLIVCHLWRTGDKALRKRLLLLLHQQGHTLHDTTAIVTEMIEMMGESEQQSQFRSLLSSLESDIPPADSQKSLTKEELKERIAQKRKRQRRDP